MLFFKEKINESEVLKFGFLGGVAESAHIFLLVLVMAVLTNMQASPGLIVQFIGLSLFVFSAAVSGILVFGFPTYLALKKRYAESLMVAVITLLTIVIIGLLVFVLFSII